MNILVTGANGQLGSEMRLLAALDNAAGDNYIFTDINDVAPEQEAMLGKLVERELAEDGCNCDGVSGNEGKAKCSATVDVATRKLDITNLVEVKRIVAEEKIDVIVNCAAYTNVDAAESNYELAELLNAKAPENLAMAIAEVGGLLVHISTDYVFGKEPYNVPCREDQKGTPTGVYGLTKLHGEQKIMAAGCKYVILRTAWLYSEFGKNFCRTMLNLLATKTALSVVFDQAGTPTYAADLAAAIAVILKNYALETCCGSECMKGENSPAGEAEAKALHKQDCLNEICSGIESCQGDNYSKTGIYNYSNEGVCSWFDFTKMIQRISGEIADKADNGKQRMKCKVQPCHSNEFPSPVVRPAYSVLDKTKIKETFGIGVPYWVDSLGRCLANLLR